VNFLFLIPVDNSECAITPFGVSANQNFKQLYFSITS